MIDSVSNVPADTVQAELHHAYSYTVSSPQLRECFTQVTEGGGGPGAGADGST